MNKHSLQSQTGASLLEVLIVIIIISIGVLGLTKLQIFNTQTVSTTYFDTQVTIYMEEMIERLQSNKASAVNGDFNTSLTAASNLPSGESQVIQGRYNWAQSLSSNVPSSEVSIQCNLAGLCLVAIQYRATQGLKEQVLMTQL